MAVEADALQISIEAESGKAAKKIDALIDSMNRLKAAVSGSSSLGAVSTQLAAISKAVQSASSSNKGLASVASSLKQLSSLKAPAGLDMISERLSGVRDAVSGIPADAGSRLADLGNGLQALAAAKDVKISANIGNQLSAISQAVSRMDIMAGERLEQLAKGLGAFAAVGNAKISASIASQLTALNTAVNGIDLLSGLKLEQLANGLRPLTELGKANLTSFISQLGKLPGIISQLDAADLGKFARQMQDVAAAITPLANEMNKVAAGFSAFPAQIQRLISSNAGLAASNSKLSRSYSGLGKGFSGFSLRTGAVLIAMKQLAGAMSGWVAESNAYIENLNLFTVAMGKYADKAKEYAEIVQDAVGIDASAWMRNQGIFMQIATGFGVVSDKAALMSKNLTQIGYDISSFFNIDIQSAMEKVQSGISGELEPLRRLGYALDQATLQQIAYDNGIKESISTMTQAEKAQLRYIAIMQQSENVMGDMARTVMTPSNAIRILSEQFTQLARAAGNLLLPVLERIIPVVQAVVQVLTEAVNRLAVFFGFKLPDIDYSGMESFTESTEDAGAALEDAKEEAKKLKDYTLGFDELNIIKPEDKEEEGEAGAGGYGGDWELEKLPEYDFLEYYEPQAESLVDFIKDLLRRLLEPFKEFFEKIRDRFKEFFATLAEQFKQWDFGKLLLEIWDELARTLGAAANLLVQTILPLIEALNIPAILFSGLTALKELINMVGDAIIAATDGAVAFVEIGLVPIAEWIGEKLVEAFNWLAEEFRALGDWFTDMTDYFTELGVQAGTLAANLWSMVEPIADSVWYGFLDILSRLVDIFQGVIEVTIAWATWLAESVNTVYQFLDSIGVIDAITGVISNAITAIMGMIDGLLESINGILTFLTGVFRGDWEKAWQGIAEIFSGIWHTIEDFIGSFFGVTWVETLTTWWEQDVETWFASDLWKSLFSVLGISMNEELVNFVEGWKTLVNAWWEANVKPWFSIDKWKQLASDAIEGLKNGLSNMFGLGADSGENFVNGFRSKDGLDSHSPSKAFADAGQDAVDGFMQSFKNLSGIVVIAQDVLAVILLEVEKAIDQAESLIKYISDIFESALNTSLAALQKFTKDVVSHYRAMANQSVGLINDIIRALDDIPREIVTVHRVITENVEVDVPAEEADIDTSSSSSYSVKAMADGGVLNSGELFIARESGPEMVGQIGSRTAVANNDQIVSGIERGVESANIQVVAALYQMLTVLERIAEKETDIQIDGESVLAAAGIKRSSRGYNLGLKA